MSKLAVDPVVFGNLIVIGTIAVPHSKDKRSPKERQEKRHLVRQGATTFKEEVVR
jgi:hypothetical protein